MKKKLLTVLMLLMCLMLALSGCGGKKDDSKTSSKRSEKNVDEDDDEDEEETKSKKKKKAEDEEDEEEEEETKSKKKKKAEAEEDEEEEETKSKKKKKAEAEEETKAAKKKKEDAAASKDSVVGRYTAYAVETEGMCLKLEDWVGILGDDFNSDLTLEEGGSGRMTFDGDSADIEWELSGKKLSVTADGETVYADWEYGYIAMDMNGEGLIYYTNDKSDISKIKISSLEEILSSGLMGSMETYDDIAGFYELYGIENSKGQVISLEELLLAGAEPFDSTLNVKDDNTMILANNDEMYEANWTLDGTKLTVEDDTSTVKGTYEYGIIRLESEGLMLIYTKPTSDTSKLNMVGMSEFEF